MIASTTSIGLNLILPVGSGGDRTHGSRRGNKVGHCWPQFPTTTKPSLSTQKELPEAALTLALVKGDPVPGPAELGVEAPAFLNGMGEAVGELRRHILDVIRGGDLARGEAILREMDDIYSALVTFDYPDALTGGLRRTTDSVRGILEKTRGDLTTSLRQDQLREAMGEALAAFARQEAARDPDPRPEGHSRHD